LLLSFSLYPAGIFDIRPVIYGGFAFCGFPSPEGTIDLFSAVPSGLDKFKKTLLAINDEANIEMSLRDRSNQKINSYTHKI
jgi:hypothetical protein